MSVAYSIGRQGRRKSAVLGAAHSASRSRLYSFGFRASIHAVGWSGVIFPQWRRVMVISHDACSSVARASQEPIGAAAQGTQRLRRAASIRVAA